MEIRDDAFECTAVERKLSNCVINATREGPLLHHVAMGHLTLAPLLFGFRLLAIMSTMLTMRISLVLEYTRTSAGVCSVVFC